MIIRCPFAREFGKWIECPHLDHGGYIADEIPQFCKDNGSGMGKGGSWCAKMIGKAMLAHKIWIGNDY
jgi:hypothetical protein